VVKLVDTRGDPEAAAAVRAELDAFACIDRTDTRTAAHGDGDGHVGSSSSSTGSIGSSKAHAIARFVLRPHGPAGVWRGLEALPLEYAAGGDLMGVLQRRRGVPLPVSHTRVYLAEMSLALQHLHTVCGVWVRDVSLTNTMLDARGHVLIGDFGSACRAASGRVTGVACAPEFAAPEVARTHKDYCDGAADAVHPYDGGTADWWAFGVVAFELMASRPPWWDPNANRLLALLAAGPPVVSFPEGVAVHPDGMSLCQELLCPDDDAFRCRCDDDIRSHAFFAGVVDWDKLGEGEGPDPPTREEIETAARFPEYPLDTIPRTG
jgi:serine/threonine protein kinase